MPLLQLLRKTSPVTVRSSLNKHLVGFLKICTNERMMSLPRTARKKSGTKIYHMIVRGINRQTIFEEEEDATTFLQVLKKYKERSGYKIYGYA
jgi:hypothetical protein